MPENPKTSLIPVIWWTDALHTPDRMTRERPRFHLENATDAMGYTSARCGNIWDRARIVHKGTLTQAWSRSLLPCLECFTVTIEPRR